MRRKFLLPALAATAMLAIGAPVASASKAHISASNTGNALKFLLKANHNRASEIGALRDQVKGLTQAIGVLHGALDPIVAAVPSVVGALTSINAALTNSTTGLVGLNLARPQFGTFNGSTGVIAGGTGQVSGASGPKANATRASAGSYVVDFGNDVSKRSLNVAVSPGSGAVVGEAVDCANAGGACPSGDTSANHVWVLLYVLASNSNNQVAAGVSADTGATTAFTVTAISG